MEGHGLDELAASADAVVAGLGPLAVQLARLAVEAGRAVTLNAMELLAIGQGREISRGVVQLGLDTQDAAEVRLPRVTGVVGVPRRVHGDRRRDEAAGPATRNARSEVITANAAQMSADAARRTAPSAAVRRSPATRKPEKDAEGACLLKPN